MKQAVGSYFIKFFGIDIKRIEMTYDEDKITVKQFIEKLLEFPDDTEIRIIMSDVIPMPSLPLSDVQFDKEENKVFIYPEIT